MKEHGTPDQSWPHRFEPSIGSFVRGKSKPAKLNCPSAEVAINPQSGPDGWL